MRQTPGMAPLRKLRLSLVMTLAAFAIAGFAAGCGDDDDGGSAPAGGGTAVESENPSTGETGPASAGDEREQAPDDAISDRPGGPNDEGGNSEDGGQVPSGGDESLSTAPQPKPVKP